ncbi:glycosyltransferase [Tenacibaculum amylolyticum]|uniref:glycosyltransferase n=1 Tax=Tenacibaculum amylolyticum TaxID=104269 RepID=UPI0038963C69
MIHKKSVFVAVTNDISTDQRVHKVCMFLLKENFDVFVYGRILPNTIDVNRPYTIYRKKHWFNNNFLFYAEYNIRLFLFLLFKKYNYILSNDLDTLSGCFVASKLKTKTKLVYDSHELFSEGPELQGRRFVQNFWRTLEKLFLPRIRKAYTVSQSIVNFYHERHNNNMGLIRNLPLLNRTIVKKEVHFPTENKVVLYQGVLNPGRGIKPMIQALQYLENVDLVIIGYGKVESELKAFVISEKMEGRVHFLGRVAHEVLPNYTRKADIGMVLEEPLGKSFEFSLPNKLFDYIHAELPIVSGRLPEITKIVEEYEVGVVVDSYEPEDIAKAVQKLLEDKELRKRIKRNQQKAKQILCWEKEQEKLNEYFIN